jgi:Fic family protein
VQSSLRQQSTCTSSACTRSKTATAAWAARLLKNHWRKVSASRPSFPLPTQLSAAKRLLCGARAQKQGYRDHRLADVFRRNSSRGTAQHDQRVEFYIAKAKLYEKLRGQLNERQEKVIARMFREGIDGFKGGLSADNYIRIAKTSRATATRDLSDLISKGALTRTGELRHTRYHLNLFDPNEAD